MSADPETLAAIENSININADIHTSPLFCLYTLHVICLLSWQRI